MHAVWCNYTFIYLLGVKKQKTHIFHLRTLGEKQCGTSKGGAFVFLMWYKNVIDWKTGQEFQCRSTRFPLEFNYTYVDGNRRAKWNYKYRSAKFKSSSILLHYRTLVAWGLLPIWVESGWCLSGAPSWPERVSLSRLCCICHELASLQRSLLLAPCTPPCSEALTALLRPLEQEFAVTLAKSDPSEAPKPVASVTVAMANPPPPPPPHSYMRSTWNASTFLSLRVTPCEI